MTQADDIKALKKEVLTLKKRVKKLEAQATPQDVEEEPEVVETPEPEIEYTAPVKKRAPSKPVPIGTILGWIGAVILGLGFIFLVAYAIDQGWLSKTLQIILGVLAGGIVAYAGHQLAKKTKLQGELLMGTGTALAYFSVYAGYALESYRDATGLGIALTIALLIIVLAAAVMLAMKQHSGVLLIETVLLAHITTLLTDYTWVTVAYILLVMAAFVTLLTKHDYQGLGWYGGGITAFFALIHIPQVSLAQSSTLVGGLFIAFTTLSILRDNHLGEVLTFITAYLLGTFIAGTTTLTGEHLTLGAAVVAALLGWITLTKKSLNNWYFIASAALLAFWVPLALTGYLITAAWFILALLIGWVGFNHQQTYLPETAGAIALLGFIRLLFIDTWKLSGATQVWTFLLAAAALLALAYRAAQNNRGIEAAIYYCGSALSLLVLILLQAPAEFKTLLLVALGTTSYLFGEQRGIIPRYAGIAIIGFALMKIIVFDAHNNFLALTTSTRILTLGVIAVVYLVLGEVAHHHDRWEAYALIPASMITLLAIIYAEVTGGWSALSVTIVAIAAAMFGVQTHRPAYHYTGLGAALLGYVGVLGLLGNTDNTLVLVSTIITAALLYMTSYAQAVKGRVETHITYVASTLLLFILVGDQLSKAWITVVWGVLGALSFFLGIQTSRNVPKTTGLVILAIAVLKLFLVDTLSLSAGLRVVAYIVLGALLLGGSIAYAKRKD